MSGASPVHPGQRIQLRALSPHDTNTEHDVPVRGILRELTPPNLRPCKDIDWHMVKAGPPGCSQVNHIGWGRLRNERADNLAAPWSETKGHDVPSGTYISTWRPHRCRKKQRLQTRRENKLVGNGSLAPLRPACPTLKEAVSQHYTLVYSILGAASSCAPTAHCYIVRRGAVLEFHWVLTASLCLLRSLAVVGSDARAPLKSLPAPRVQGEAADQVDLVTLTSPCVDAKLMR